MDPNNNASWKAREVVTSWFRQCNIPRRKLSTVPSRLILVVLLFFITFKVLLPLLCHDWVYSMYFKGKSKDQVYVARALDLNTERLYWAQGYFTGLAGDGAPRSELPKWRDDETIELVVVIIGKERKIDSYNPRYLIQTSAEVHKQYIQDTYFSNKRLFICDVDEKPQNNEDLDDIGQHVRVVSRFGSEYPNEKKSSDSWTESKEDYTFCLARAHEYNPDYVLMFEDDVILKPNFFSYLYQTLNTNVPLVQDSPASQQDDADWAYIKLFYPPKWSGYSKNFRHYVELAGAATSGGSIFVLLQFVILYTIHKKRSVYRDYTLFWFIVGFLYSLCVCITIGRPYVKDDIFSLTHHSKIVPSEECCTPAVLYSGDVIPHLIDNLERSRSSANLPHDLMMDRWVDDNGFVRYLVEPSMVHHIGLVSTRSSARGWAKNAAYYIY